MTQLREQLQKLRHEVDVHPTGNGGVIRRHSFPLTSTLIDEIEKVATAHTKAVLEKLKQEAADAEVVTMEEIDQAIEDQK